MVFFGFTKFPYFPFLSMGSAVRGHHLFEAADSAFSAQLTALESSELRRWLLGPRTRRWQGYLGTLRFLSFR